MGLLVWRSQHYEIEGCLCIIIIMQGSRGGVDDMEMELLYHRLIQLTYLDVVVSIDTIRIIIIHACVI